MSDSVVKLRIDSKEYDANIKRAGDALTDYFRKVKEGGGTLMHLDEGVMEAVQAMGEMGTMAKNAKGGLRELTQATTDMTLAYRSLTDEEKNSPLGQAMAQSIQQMTDRAGEMRDAMDDVNLSIKNVASDTATFDQIAGAANVATSGFQVLQGATKVLGIEMGDNVEIIAKLQAAMAVTNGLSQIQAALQKQSAFMQGMMAAKTALATVAQQAYAVATGEATAAQVAFNIAADANPYGLILATIGLAVGAITAFSVAISDSTEDVKDAKGEMDTLTASVNDAAKAYERLATKIKNLGIGGQKEYSLLHKSLVKQYNDLRRQEFDVVDKMHSYERAGNTDDPRYIALKEQHDKIKEEGKKIKNDIDDLERANNERKSRLTKYAGLNFSDITSQSEAESAISFLKEQIKYVDNTTAAYKQLKRAIEYAEKTVLPQFTDDDKSVKAVKQTVKKIKEEVEKEPVEVEIQPTGDMTNFEKLQQSIRLEISAKNLQVDETTLRTLMKDAIQKGIDGMDLDFQSIQEQMDRDGFGPSDEAWQKIIDKYNALRQAIGENPIQIDLTTGNEAKPTKDKPAGKQTAGDGLEKFLKGDYAKITGGVNSIASGIQQMGIEIPKEIQSVLGVLTGISSIMTGITSILSLILVAEQVTATTSTVKAIPVIGWALANGGIVPHAANGYFVGGNSYSGDNTPIMANAGELVLNKSSQNNLASMITEAESRGRSGNGLARVSGEQIWIALNAYTKRTGQGELVTWK